MARAPGKFFPHRDLCFDFVGAVDLELFNYHGHACSPLRDLTTSIAALATMSDLFCASSGG